MTDADRLRLALLPGEDRCIAGDPAHVCGLLADEVRRLRAELEAADAAERERCAAVAEDMGSPEVAARIREGDAR